jgi:hypothetical protein
MTPAIKYLKAENQKNTMDAAQVRHDNDLVLFAGLTIRVCLVQYNLAQANKNFP